MQTQGNGLGWMLPRKFRFRSREALNFTSLRWPRARSILEWANRAQLRLCHLVLLVARDTLGLVSSLSATTVADWATSVLSALYFWVVHVRQ